MVDPQPVQNTMVEFENEVSGSDEAFSLFCVNYILNAFASDHGKSIRPVTIRISYHPQVRWGGEKVPIPWWTDEPWFTIKRAGKAARGFYVAEKDLIYITAGRWGTASVLYHELCHMYFAPRDVDHDHLKWPEWDDRRRELRRELIKVWWEWHRSGKHDAFDEKVNAEVAAAELAARKN
jgi:hypothetical protein